MFWDELHVHILSLENDDYLSIADLTECSNTNNSKIFCFKVSNIRFFITVDVFLHLASSIPSSSRSAISPESV